MNADVQYIIILVNKPDRFLHFTVNIDLFKSAKFSDAMINVHNIISGLQTFNSFREIMPGW